ncbi:hypothetical protein D3C79_892880 [compost metagenome]
MAIFRQARAFDIQFWRRVAVDRPQQLEAALGACRVALLTVGAIAFEAVCSILDQRLALARQGGEFGAVQMRRIGTDRQHLLLLPGVQRLGALQQFALARRPIVDAFHQARLLDRLDRVGGNCGQRKL